MRRQDESKPAAAPATAPATAPVKAGPAAAEAALKSEPDLADQKPAKGARDGFVLLCIMVVAVAIGTMLFAQLGLSLGASIGAGAMAWVLFMLLHKQVQKSAQIAELQSELARTRFQNAKPQRPAALRGMKPVPLAGGNAPDSDMRPEMRQEPRHPDFGPVRAGAPSSSAKSPSISPAGVAASKAAADAVQPAAAGRIAAAGGVAPGSHRPATNSDIGPTAPQARPAMPPLRAAVSHSDNPANDAAAAAEAAASVDLTGMRLPAGGGAAMAPGADDDRGPQGAAVIRDQWSFRPRTDVSMAGGANAAARPATTVEGDLELVQRKIRELADEVNFVEASRPPKPTRPEIRSTPTTEAIEHSIGALKAAATTMRERPGGLGDFIPKSVMTDPVRNKSPEPADLPSAAPSQIAPDQALPPQTLPGLGELVIPATAERIAGSDKATPNADSDPAPRLELQLPDHPLFDLGLSSAPPAAMLPHSREIAQAIEDAAVDVFLAPVVTLSAHAVNHYEMTVALRSGDGARLDTGEEDIAMIGRELAAKFDIERLQRAAALSVRMEARDKDGSLLIEIMGSSLSERAFLETIAKVYGARPKVANQLVVTLTQRAIDDLTPSDWQTIRDMHAYGFRFALDRLEHTRTDFAALTVAGFRFVRLPSQVLFDGLDALERFVPAEEIRQRATLAGLSIIASGIADAKSQKRLLDMGVDLGQGALFGVPRQVMLSGAANQSAAA